MASFTGVGDNVTLVLKKKGDRASIALSGTYAMRIVLQKAERNISRWKTIKEWKTADATVAENYEASADDEQLRLIVKEDTSGTCTALLTELRSNRQPLVIVPDVAVYSVRRQDSGKVHIFPNLTADCSVRLPSPEDGLDYTFIYGGIAADAQDWNIDTGSNTNYFMGGLVHLDHDAGSAGDEIVPLAPDGNSNSKLNILVPHVGTRIRLLCDGILWYVEGTVCSATIPTFAD